MMSKRSKRTGAALKAQMERAHALRERVDVLCPKSTHDRLELMGEVLVSLLEEYASEHDIDMREAIAWFETNLELTCADVLAEDDG